ncbi:MAG: glutathione peroxidase [Pseudomonadota bacterium]
MFRRSFLAAAAASTFLPRAARAGSAHDFVLPSIDGGDIALADWRGRPILVVNTASLCGFTPQLEALQALHERYGPEGVLVLGVPSNDFRQELATAEEVHEFCAVNYAITFPMTEILQVRGRGAHPLYAWMAESADVRPRWNFTKVLIGPDGRVARSWGSATRPLGREITGALDAMLAAG